MAPGIAVFGLDEFFAPADGFTVSATLDGGPTFYAHFDAAYVEALGVASAGPVATCKSADVYAAVVGQAISIDQDDYRIVTIEPDGAGVTVLRLHKIM